MDTQREQEFLTRLWELQRAAGLSDSALARDLEVDASLITHMKAGRKGKQLGLRFGVMAIQRFPELASFLFRELTIISGPLTKDREVKAS